MAINPEKREDLMLDATAYTRRALYRDSQSGNTFFIGFRQNGGWSVYFDEDPVFQFDAGGKLRRVHFENQNYAAHNGKLCLLERERHGGRIEIQRIYSADAERRVLEDCLKRLRALAELIPNNDLAEVEQFPLDDVDLIPDITKSICGASQEIKIASSANA